MEELIIPNSVTSIGEFAFSYSKLPNITLPNQCTVIKFEI